MRRKLNRPIPPYKRQALAQALAQVKAQPEAQSGEAVEAAVLDILTDQVGDMAKAISQELVEAQTPEPVPETPAPIVDLSLLDTHQLRALQEQTAAALAAQEAGQ